VEECRRGNGEDDLIRRIYFSLKSKGMVGA
jgi:hypothetical protein